MEALQFAVFGHPVAHSLSPRIHQAFARQFGARIEYRALDATPEAFAAAVRRFFAEGGVGANVTVPHKRAAWMLAAERSARATRAEAANVLARRPDGSVAADNVDGAGFVRDLRERHRQDPGNRRVLLVGAGGAARGVAWNLLEAGVRALVIANRTRAAAVDLAAALGDAGRVRACGLDELAGGERFDVVVNATSAGLLGRALGLPPALVGPDTFCYDLSYARAALPFLAWAAGAGAAAATDGLGMLVETAADSYAIWHGTRPDTEPVYRALRAELGGAPDR